MEEIIAAINKRLGLRVWRGKLAIASKASRLSLLNLFVPFVYRIYNHYRCEMLLEVGLPLTVTVTDLGGVVQPPYVK